MMSTDNWCLKVASKIYGPYTIAQMEAFASEGRLTMDSMIAPAGSKVWRPAKQYSNFQAFFADKPAAKTASFGRSNGAKASSSARGGPSNFLIIFDIVSGAASRLEHIVKNLGPAIRLMDNIWAVSTDQSVTGIKNMLVPHLQIREPIFVIDASNGKSSWQNFTPEKHSQLTTTWKPKIA